MKGMTNLKKEVNENGRSSQLTPYQQQLIVDHFEYAQKVAFKSSLAKSMPHDDLIDLAIEGLVKAATCFQPEREVKFTSFAYRVIHNHLIDKWKKDYKELPVSDFDEGLVVQNTVDNELRQHDQRQRLHDFLIQNQHDREINLLIHRYFNCEDKPTTQSDLTSFYNLSQAQISYLEKKGRERIQQQLHHF